MSGCYTNSEADDDNKDAVVVCDYDDGFCIVSLLALETRYCCFYMM